MTAVRELGRSAARNFNIALVISVIALSATFLAGTAAAAPVSVAFAGGFLDLSVAVGQGTPQTPGDVIGGVKAPPSNSVDLSGAQAQIRFGPDVIAQAKAISSTADVGAASAAKSDVNGILMSTAAGDLTMNDVSSTVSCVPDKPAVALANGPSSITLNGLAVTLDQNHQTVAAATGSGQVGTVTITITTPAPDLQANAADARGAVVVIDEVLTAPAASTRSVSLTVAESSCSPPVAPSITSVSPDTVPGSQSTQVTVTGAGFVTNQTSVSIGAVTMAPNQVLVTSDTGLTFQTPPNQSPETVLLSVTTPSGSSNALPFRFSSMRTTSGVLRDAATGAPLSHGCVLVRPIGTTRWFLSAIGDFGKWSFDSDEPGPFALAFYTTAGDNCDGPPQVSPVPSWFENIALTGDPKTVTIPRGVSEVPSGTSGVVACLGLTALPTTKCVNPTAVLSGRVTGQLVAGPVTPVNEACIVILAGNPTDGMVGFAVSTTNGSWTAQNLPLDTPMIVAVLPPFGGKDGPCSGGDGPPISPPGSLQPVFFRNAFVDLANPGLQNDPFGWAISHGATAVPNGTSHVDVCLTTAPGTAVPRPVCTGVAAGSGSTLTSTVTVPTTVTSTVASVATTSLSPAAVVTTTALTGTSAIFPANSSTLRPGAASGPDLANTGFRSADVMIAGSTLLLLGVGLMVTFHRVRERRRKT